MVGFREQRRGGLAPPGSRASPPPVRRGMGRGEGGTPVSRGVCVPLPARTYLPATSLEVGFGGGGGEGVLRAPPPPPHAPSRPWRRPRLPSFPTGRGPPGVDPPVACRGLRGVTGWRLPVAGGRPPCPVASRRRPWTGLPRPVAGRSSAALGACRAVARRLPRARPPPPPRASGLSPTPAPNDAACGSLSGSLALSRPPLTSVVCPPLPAGRHASRRSPLPAALGGGGGGGCLGTRARVRGAPVDGGESCGGVPGEGAGRVCEVVWWGGEASAPFRGGRVGGWSPGVGGGTPPGAVGPVHGEAPMRHGPAAPRPAGGRGCVCGMRWLVVGVGAVARGACRAPSPASPFPGT